MHVSIAYDGECPVCRHVVRASRLRERTAALDLIDARRNRLDDVQGQDLRAVDFDEGFAVVVDGQVHHGADGARVLAALTERRGAAFRLFQWLVRTERRSRLFYPLLRAGRNLLLKILRVPKIANS
ncbi:MAG: DCC1-like thiol-disulfide oxidoreductase family protein [Wenzhouxiangellaceae bacterium]